MAMLYRKDIFDKHSITPPATWAEFADAAKKLHAADPNVFLTDALFSNGGNVATSRLSLGSDCDGAWRGELHNVRREDIGTLVRGAAKARCRAPSRSAMTSTCSASAPRLAA